MSLRWLTKLVSCRAFCLASLLACGLSSTIAVAQTSQLRVSVLPDTAEASLRERYRPLVEYLKETTGYEILLVIPPDYARLLEEFDADRIDLAWFGGLTFAQARARSGARPLVTRDIDIAFTSDFIAGPGFAPRELEAFKGRRFAFGPRLSTSGHLMPRAHLEGSGLVAERIFSTVKYSYGHDQTVEWVRDGVVDLGSVNSTIFRSLQRRGAVPPDAVRVVATTAPYQNYVWATRAALENDTRLVLLDAFLALDPAEPAGAAVLRTQNAGGYLPIDSSAYVQLEELARRLGLLGELR